MTALTATLILGVVVVVGAMILRLSGAGDRGGFDPRAVSAERVALPAGEAIVAVGGAGPALVVATRDAEGRERLRLFDAETGAASAVVVVERDGP